MSAMDNATRNAGDMINKLTITYNRSAPGADHQGTDRNHFGRGSALTASGRRWQAATPRTRTDNKDPAANEEPQRGARQQHGEDRTRQGAATRRSAPSVGTAAGHPGHRRRRRRAVRRPPAGDPERARDRRTAATAWCSKSRSISAKTPCAASPWTRPKAWCAARRSTTPARRSSVPVGAGTLGRIINVIGEPVDEAGPVDRRRRRAPSTSRRRPMSSSRPKRRSSSPASRSSTCSRPTPAAARSACSAAPASARPC